MLYQNNLNDIQLYDIPARLNGIYAGGGHLALIPPKTNPRFTEKNWVYSINGNNKSVIKKEQSPLRSADQIHAGALLRELHLQPTYL